MPRRRGITNPVAGLASPARVKASPLHSVLSAVIFSRNAQDKGATAFVHSGEIAKTGNPGYIVGGQRDRAGRQVSTETEPVADHAALDKVMQHRSRIRRGTDSPQAAVGYWRDPAVKGSPYEVDSSAIFNDRSTAKVIGKKRGEKAIHDLSTGTDIRLDGKR